MKSLSAKKRNYIKGIANKKKIECYRTIPLKEGTLFDNLDEWLTTKQAAEYLKVSEGTLRNMCCNGSIPYYKLERRNRYRMSDLRDLLLKNQKGVFYGL